MKWTALLGAAVLLLAASQATAAPQAIKGVVVATHARTGTVVVATGRKGVAVSVRTAPRRVRLGDRVSVAGSRVRVLSHVQRTRLHGLVVKRLAHALRVASGRSVLTIQTRGRALASDDHGPDRGEIGEFEVEFEHGALVEDGFARVEEKVEAKGTVMNSTASQITIDARGAAITFAAPAGTTLPVIAQGTFVEARGVTVDGVLTLTRLHVEDCDGGDAGGGHGPHDGGCDD
jgi:RNase P/RNase MRP subunit p29